MESIFAMDEDMDGIPAPCGEDSVGEILTSVPGPRRGLKKVVPKGPLSTKEIAGLGSSPAASVLSADFEDKDKSLSHSTSYCSSLGSESGLSFWRDGGCWVNSPRANNTWEVASPPLAPAIKGEGSVLDASRCAHPAIPCCCRL